MADPSSYAKKLIASIVVLILGVTLGDTVVTIVQAINSTAWTFTGHEAVEALVALIPLLYYAGIVVGSGFAFLKTNSARIYGNNLHIAKLCMSRLQGLI